ncbi:zinc metalloproteinase nas-13-like isoform X2 [Zootermopsis nevadensis]|nr:zinc metalloproteinase nas-13-like isoform X2 [Zootermopsis nevadensis]XP_021924922.1 zinc metalloproteinase nas-13-like isoform X2 [Zootermopsis nevadensis]XP_021924923.1 zinc metalloproteinase nas-13-like isoform X2 [Zootermopsis nevadensis]
MENAGVLVLLLAARIYYCMPVLEDNSLDPEDVAVLYDETVAKDTGERVAAWKMDSEVNPEEMGLYLEGDIMTPKSRNGLTAQTARWPGGIVPYEMGSFFNNGDMAMIKAAMDEYHKKTCIRFVPRQPEHKDYLVIESSHSGCWSSVGRVGGPQRVNFQSPGCLSTVGTPIHELMHAVGFLHEQNRVERDKHVVIHWENILPGRENNFDKAKKGYADGQGVNYDYRSVLHYSSGAFSKNGLPTIEPKITGVEIGQRKGFSRGDVQKIRQMYKCSQRPPGA